jgi:hypothetical protein
MPPADPGPALAARRTGAAMIRASGSPEIACRGTALSTGGTRGRRGGQRPGEDQ